MKSTSLLFLSLLFSRLTHVGNDRNSRRKVENTTNVYFVRCIVMAIVSSALARLRQKYDDMMRGRKYTIRG